ncbi:MAG: hypothetical protein DWQ11_12335 [Proteobacteria bacterium]|nr:MAG: hypothetical protein DWQ11_12335 [Pseudomonadota bacterium]
MSIRTPIKDALRSSIEDEDAALARRLPSRAVKRRAAVKLGTKAAKRLLADDAPGRDKPAKPFDVTLSLTEAAQLKALRDRLRAEGETVSRRDLMRVAVAVLAVIEPELLRAQLKALPVLSKKDDA